MKEPFRFSVTRADWRSDGAALRAVRSAVFVVEQRVPEALEWDAHDAASLHVLARDAAGAPIGTGRLLPAGRIGRMAVVAAARGRGVGAAILRELLAAAGERGLHELELGAQTHALGFYARCGFVAEGDVYDDAGMPHRAMRLRLR